MQPVLVASKVPFIYYEFMVYTKILMTYFMIAWCLCFSPLLHCVPCTKALNWCACLETLWQAANSEGCYLQVEYGNRVLEMEHRLEEGVGGSLKHFLALRSEPPGRTATLETVLLYRIDERVFTAGLSHDLRVEGLPDSIRWDQLPGIGETNYQ